MIFQSRLLYPLSKSVGAKRNWGDLNLVAHQASCVLGEGGGRGGGEGGEGGKGWSAR